MPVEGFLYGSGGVATLHQALLGLYTAGYGAQAQSGPQIGLLRSGTWDRFTDGFLHSIAPGPITYPSRSDLGPVYEMGKLRRPLRIWVEPRFAGAVRLAGRLRPAHGQRARLQRSRWIVANTIEGGAPELYARTSKSGDRPPRAGRS